VVRRGIGAGTQDATPPHFGDEAAKHYVPKIGLSIVPKIVFQNEGFQNETNRAVKRDPTDPLPSPCLLATRGKKTGIMRGPISICLLSGGPQVRPAIGAPDRSPAD
jgi:hypothetical protein